jgi:hypothetical protein
MEKPPERITKRRERFILRFVKLFRLCHSRESNTDLARRKDSSPEASRHRTSFAGCNVRDSLILH